MKILIVEDDNVQLQYINTLLGNVINELGIKCETILSNQPSSALVSFTEKQTDNVDIVITDIELGRANGLEFARSINVTSPNTKIIYVSGHDKYNEEVYTTEHVFFLRKPVKQDSLYIAIEKCLHQLKTEKNGCLNVVSNGRTIKLKVDEILYVEACGRKLLFNTTGSEQCGVYKKLSEIEKSLGDRFVQCHKSYSVNMDYVRTHTMNEFTLIDDTKIPISRSYMKSTKDMYLKYIGAKL